MAATAAAGVVVVDARYCAPDATAFAVTKTISLTGHDFTVTDARGAAVMQVEAAAFSFLQRRSLFLDSGRRPVLTVQDSAFSMGTRWAAYGGDSTSRRDLLFVAVKSSPVQLARTKVDVFLAAAAGNGNGEQRAQADFIVRGSYYGGACTVSTGGSGGAEIARITRQDTAGGALLGRHTYTARINPGVDRALVLALAVILDEMHH